MSLTNSQLIFNNIILKIFVYVNCITYHWFNTFLMTIHFILYRFIISSDLSFAQSHFYYKHLACNYELQIFLEVSIGQTRYIKNVCWK